MLQKEVRNGMYLTRVPLKVPDPKVRNPFGTDVNLVEFIPFNQIAWAAPYTYKEGQGIGTLLLLNTLEFRCYLQNLEIVKQKVCEFVGRNARAGIPSPEFPWVISQ